MIFYFTATGNSLYVAKKLAQAQNESFELISIPQEMDRSEALVYEDDAIGVVYPIYGHMMPTLVKDFLKRASFKTSYFYFVLTYGARHANAVELCMDDAKECGITPNYISTLLMVDNWLPNFDMEKQRALIPEKHIDEELERICEEVSTRKIWIEPVNDVDRAAHEQFLSSGLSFDAKNLEHFLEIYAEECTGCGTCAKVCPAGCIRINDEGVAVRHALEGDGCNACLACIHACPSGAIELPLGEVNPQARFRNEHITLQELISANNRL